MFYINRLVPSRHLKVQHLKIVLSILCCSLLPISGEELTLQQAINLAQQNDPWLTGNQHSEDAMQSLSIAASSLPDPKMSISLANLAADSFDFSQEAMTNFKVGVSQQFPRGESLSIKQRQLELQTRQFPYQRQDRKAIVAVTVGQLWLDAFKAQESIALIEENRALFEQLADVAEARYSSSVGRTRQQDIVRAQLELTRLEDRLTLLQQQQEVAKQQLTQWLDSYFMNQIANSTSHLSLSKTMPIVELINPHLYVADATTEVLISYFARHPQVLALEQKIKAADMGISLAKQKYKPQWGVNASYGYRDSDLVGNDRADLLSIGVSFDMPFFTDNRQDKEVQSAVSKTSAIKTDKWLLLRKLYTSFVATRAQLLRIKQRQQLYQTRLLPQIHEQAEASLSSYTNDDGDFAEVVRARIAELNAEIDHLSINVEQQKSIIQLNYFFESNPRQGEIK